MKAFALSLVIVMGWVALVQAGDMQIDFPLFLRAPAAATAAASATNLQVCLLLLYSRVEVKADETSRYSPVLLAAQQRIQYALSHQLKNAA